MSGMLQWLQQQGQGQAGAPQPGQGAPQQPHPYIDALRRIWGRYGATPPPSGVPPQLPNPSPGNPHMLYDPRSGQWLDDAVFRPQYDLRNNPAELHRVMQMYNNMIKQSAPTASPSPTPSPTEGPINGAMYNGPWSNLSPRERATVNTNAIDRLGPNGMPRDPTTPPPSMHPSSIRVDFHKPESANPE